MAESLTQTPPFRLSLPHIRERLRGRSTERAGHDPMVSALPEAPGAKSRRAAVAAILREGMRGPELLFIRRAEHPSDPWSGHMAFPGGREDPVDNTLLDTAVRETREEVGLDLERSARLLGQLDQIPAVARGRRTGLIIAPYVFELLGEVALAQNYEVAETVWAPLEPLFRGELATTFSYELSGQKLQMPAHDVEGRIVWGLTHRMLEGFFQLLR